MAAPFGGQLGPWCRRSAASIAKAGLGDFQSDKQNPAFAAAWQPIATQLANEGTTPSSAGYLGASTAFANAFEQLTSTGGLGQQADAALQAAQQYVMSGNTVAGAAGMVQDLVTMGSTGAPSGALLNAFTGTMIGTAVAAGSLSAGIGAAIVLGVGLSVDVLSAAGLLGPSGATPPGCSGISCNPPSSYLIEGACVCVWDSLLAPGQKSISPGSASWRNFPNPNDPNDYEWFTPTNGIIWKGLSLFGAPGGSKARMVDTIFPMYHQLECELAVAQQYNDPRAPFIAAFFSAWKLNKAYALNGLAPQPDYQVLAHVIRQWNASHTSAGSTWSILNGGDAPITPQSSCPTYLIFYESTLVQGITNANVPGIQINSDGSISVNTAPTLIPPYRVPMQKSVGGGGQPAATSSSSSAGTALAVVAGTAALGAGGVALYAYEHGRSFGSVVKSLWPSGKGRGTLSGMKPMTMLVGGAVLAAVVGGVALASGNSGAQAPAQTGWVQASATKTIPPQALGAIVQAIAGAATGGGVAGWTPNSAAPAAVNVAPAAGLVGPVDGGDGHWYASDVNMATWYVF